MIIEKFIPPFIDFIKDNFNDSTHMFAFITSEKYLLGLTHRHNPKFFHTDSDFELLRQHMYQSDKIIFHGLWRDKLDTCLLENKEFLQKSYWIMWGADFYFPAKQTEQRREVIKEMAFLVTANFGDVDYVRKNYGANGTHINCISYLSNIFYNIATTDNNSEYVHIQVGNSATETNNHAEIFDKIRMYTNDSFKIFCPLSYGDKNYALSVKSLGRKIFGNNFMPLNDFMSPYRYHRFLSTMDFAIFDAERQQGFSNLLYLIGMGKKVFINANSNLNRYFSDLDITIYNTDNIELFPLDAHIKEKNMSIVRRTFTEEGLKQSLAKWINVG